jgi:Mycotoxin biosynthesis protein UstYa
MHTDHCIETLRISLMCQSDVTPVLLKMDSYYDPPRPQADFDSHHRCRNFDKIVAWNEEHGLSTFDNVQHHDDHQD